MIKKNWNMRLNMVCCGVEKLISPKRCEQHQSAPLPHPVKTTASFTWETYPTRKPAHKLKLIFNWTVYGGLTVSLIINKASKNEYGVY